MTDQVYTSFFPWRGNFREFSVMVSYREFVSLTNADPRRLSGRFETCTNWRKIFKRWHGKYQENHYRSSQRGNRRTITKVSFLSSKIILAGKFWLVVDWQMYRRDAGGRTNKENVWIICYRVMTPLWTPYLRSVHEELSAKFRRSFILYRCLLVDFTEFYQAFGRVQENSRVTTRKREEFWSSQEFIRKYQERHGNFSSGDFFEFCKKS